MHCASDLFSKKTRILWWSKVVNTTVLGHTIQDTRVPYGMDTVRCTCCMVPTLIPLDSKAPLFFDELLKLLMPKFGYEVLGNFG